MRLDGVVYKTIKCSHGVSVNLPILFSFNVLEKTENTIKASGFLPPGIEKILLNSEFYIYKDTKKRAKRLQKARIKEVVDSIVLIIVLDDEIVDEKRMFERIAVCIEEDFEVLELNTTASILDMSLIGVKLFFGNFVDVNPGQVLVLRHRDKMLTVKVLRKEEIKQGVILGCKIENANFDLLSYLVTNYVNQVKNLLLEKPNFSV